MFVPLLSAIMVAVLSMVHATTIHTPGDAPTIQDRLDIASPGDPVSVACGTYHEHSIEIPSAVILFSEQGR